MKERGILVGALALSIVVHASASAVLGRGENAAQAYVPLAWAPMLVRVVNPVPPAPVTVPDVAVPAVENSAPASVAAKEPAAPAGVAAEPLPAATTTSQAAPAADARSEAAAQVRPPAPEVRITSEPTLARVGWFLENRSRTEYPGEVREPVRIGDAIEVAYPAAALAVHREGEVLAWIAVDAAGAVRELNIVSGDDDFSLAVADALGPARLLPATDIDDHPIPFWAVVEFDFRLDHAGAPGSAVAAIARQPDAAVR